MDTYSKNSIDIPPGYPEYAAIEISKAGNQAAWGKKYGCTMDSLYIKTDPVDASNADRFEFDIYVKNYASFVSAIAGKSLRFYFASGSGRFDNRSTFDFDTQVKKSGWNHIVIYKSAIVNDYNTDYSRIEWAGLEFWSCQGEVNPIGDTKVRIANICGVCDAQKKEDMPVPEAVYQKSLALPYYADYKIKNSTGGFAEGVITVKVDVKTNSATDIIPYWADENGKLEGYTSLYAFRITGEKTEFEIGPSVIIPKGAKKLLLYAKDYENDVITDDCIAIDLPRGAASDENWGELITEFQVASDLHITIDGTNWNAYTNMLKDIVKLSPGSSGLFLNGDVPNSGADAEYRKHQELHALVKGAPDYYMSIGNHDFYQAKDHGDTQAQVQKRFAGYARYPDRTAPDSQHYDFWLSGYHFVFLGDDKITSDYLSSTYTDKTLRWLRKTLQNNRDVNRPIFLFNHPPIQATVAGSLGEFKGFTGVYGENAVRLKAVLKDFPEIILFNGHQHIELGYPNTMRPADSEMPTVFNTASASQVATIRDRVKTKGSGSEGYYVYVYADKIIVRGRDFKNAKWIPSAQFCVKTGQK